MVFVSVIRCCVRVVMALGQFQRKRGIKNSRKEVMGGKTRPQFAVRNVMIISLTLSALIVMTEMIRPVTATKVNVVSLTVFATAYPPIKTN